MTQNFKFENIGKRMPYTVPSETFDTIEANVFSTLKNDKLAKSQLRLVRLSSISGIAAAACVALLLTLKPTVAEQSNPLTQIDLAYANLSEADQEYLIEIYQEDFFLNQEQE